MRKVIVMGRRAPGRTRLAAQAHMRDIHAGLVLLAPEDAGEMPSDYTQNHVFDGVYPSAGAHAIERDLFTEIKPAAAKGPRALTPYFRDTLQPDEKNFVDNATVVKLFTETQLRKVGPPGEFKVFLALTGGDPETASTAIGHALSSAINYAVPGPSGEPLFVDHVVEFWFAERPAAAAVLEQWPALLAATGADPTASFAVAAEQFDSTRLRAGLTSK